MPREVSQPYIARTGENATKRLKAEITEEEPPAASSSARGYQPLDQSLPRQAARHTAEIVDLLSRFASDKDVAQVLSLALEKSGKKWPDL